MSAGSSSFFCKNGHCIYSSFEDEVCYEEKTDKCPYCDCTFENGEIASVYEWYDESYQFDEKTGKPDLDMVVPHKPITHETQYSKLDMTNLYFEEKEGMCKLVLPKQLYYTYKIPIYDVHKLFTKKGKVRRR